MRYGSLNRCRFPGRAPLSVKLFGRLLAIAIVSSVLAQGVVVLTTGLMASPSEERPTPDLATLSDPVCNLRHPIGVKITPAGLPVRGGALDMQVVVDPEVDLSNVQVELVSAGGTQPIGATRAVLGGVGKDLTALSQFSVSIPQDGKRFLLQFLVQAEGPSGPLSRLATYNVLPDGPADAGRVITTPEGAHLREYAARRIDQ